jgi:hypothetical protein
VTGEWRKLHNEELQNLYSSPSIIRMIKSKKNEMGRACTTNAAKSNAYRIYVVKPEKKKRLLGTPRCRCVGNIKMALREIRWGYMDWIDLAQDTDERMALVNTVMNLRVP